MQDATAHGLDEVRRKLTEAAEQLGRLTVVHDRLRAEQQRLAPHPEPDREVEDLDADMVPTPATEPEPEGDWGNDTLDRPDRDAYLEAIRQRMYRVLYALDFILVHATIDRFMLADAREALVDAIDSADACLMLGGAGVPGSGDPG